MSTQRTDYADGRMQPVRLARLESRYNSGLRDLIEVLPRELSRADGEGWPVVMRPEVEDLVAMGPLPENASAADDLLRLEEYQRILDSISKPVSDEEAAALVQFFGPDDCFGMAWTLVHLVESAPGWPLLDRLSVIDNRWASVLRERATTRS